MIDIRDKKDCVGCAGCVQVCPKQCISFNEDLQGFRYPEVDLNLCIHCNLCEKVCPVINQAEPQVPKIVYAAGNSDEEIKEQSSSGGVFHALARQVIDEGGVVFGARFNEEWEIVHGYAEDLDGIKAFQTSKYVQSYIGESFRNAEGFLKEGRKVLFSGTPCQIAALNRYLKKDYGTQLIRVDIVCHGVPSPRIWRDYLDTLLRQVGARKNFQSTPNDKMPIITRINFRNKKLGWREYGFSVNAVVHKDRIINDSQSTSIQNEEQELFFEPHYENLFMRGFLSDLYLRPSCYDCPAKKGKSHADITLADFWGIQKWYPEYFSEGCVSLLLVKTEIGQEILHSLDSVCLKDAVYKTALRGNPAIEKDAVKPKQYDSFWESYQKTGISAITDTLNSMRPTFIEQMKRVIHRIAGTLIPKLKK